MVVEAEALFGEEAKQKVMSLHISAQRLKLAIEMHHRDEMRPAMRHQLKMEEEQKPGGSIHQQNFNIINGIHPGMMKGEGEERYSFYDDDGFQGKLDSAVLGIREYFSVFIK